MKINLLTLNCWEFTLFDKIVEFVNLHKPDIITFQEASTIPILEENKSLLDKVVDNYILEFAKATNYKFIFSPSWGVIDKDGIKQGKGLVIYYQENSKLKLIDYFAVDFKNYLEYPKYLPIDEEPLRKALSKMERYPASWRKPLNYAVALFEIDRKYLKVLTTQLCISYFCTDTLQRTQQAQEISEYIKSSAELPTILTGDFNITVESESMRLIRNSSMKLETDHLKNTLDESIHPIFDPNRIMKGSANTGYGVDHILSKNIVNANLSTFQKAGISDHIPLILEFEI